MRWTNLLKPIDADRFAEAMERARRQLKLQIPTRSKHDYATC